MNKIFSIMSLAVLGLAFAACDDVEESLSVPQTNPQEAIFDSKDLEVTPPAEVVNLQECNAEGTAANIGQYAVKDFPTGSSLGFVIEMSKTADFANATTVKAAADTAAHAIVTNADDMQAAIYSKITRNPAQLSLYVRYLAYAVNGSEQVRIGGPDAYYGVGEIMVKPFDPAKVIEDNYYLVSGAPAAISQAVKMEHSDINPYDDPVFSLVVNVSAADAQNGFEWYIVPATTYEGAGSLAFAPVDPQQMSGNLSEAEAGAVKPGLIADQGPHMVKVNMLDGTYEVSLAIEQLYTPGEANGWNQMASQVLPAAWDYINYRGYAHLNGAFKFSSEPNWSGVNYGAAYDDEGYLVNGALSTASDAKDLRVSADGLYWCHVNLASLTYTATEITSLGMIGAFNDWGGQTVMTPSADFLIWTGDVTLAVGQEWKFRANDDWSINLGGSLDNLTLDGSNMICDEAGTYTVTLDLSALPYTATMVKK